ncbi:MAG: sigma-70 family RNA polymerase sigma factor [Chitinophagaceae bacterium]|nr:sigma-70 family RNA polymerase sigma factor [Chitinophagaceae bacterium]
MTPVRDDQQLLAALQRGDETAFDQLFRDYFIPLSYFAQELTGDTLAAEDIVQDCFVSLWNRRNKLPNIESFKSYLYTSVRYQCMKSIKKRKREEAVTLETAPAPAADASLVVAETARAILSLLATLTPRLQQVIRLYYLEGKSYREIAQLLKIDPESVRKQKFRALGQLRKLTGKGGGECK